MKRLQSALILSFALCVIPSHECEARGGRGGGPVGGASRGVSRGPSNFGGGMSRSPSMNSPASRPSAPRPTTPRPNVGQAGNVRPGASPSRVPTTAAGARPGAGTGTASRPSAGDLNNFLNIKPGAGQGTATGGAAGEFLRNTNTRPSTLPGNDGRPGKVGDGVGPGDRDGLRPSDGLGDRLGAGNRADWIGDREQGRADRNQRRDEVRDQVRDNHPRLDFWSDYPNWAAWRINRPYRWATWGALTGWVAYGWGEPVYYNYGDNVYYDNGTVYYGDNAVASEEEYAQQAQDIAQSAPQVDVSKEDWLPLGVFALTPAGQATGPDPSLFLQLAISKEGIVGGTLYNSANDTTQAIEGMADKSSQRVAWHVDDQSRPIMETGIANLTTDTVQTLVHFANGQTQQWLMVRLNDPSASPREEQK
ncbi:hypothetical protein SH661x_003036 [Planctomicrobium sp. SH661]|uniref:hypothetical protein n=1 Tax=Planctomicrobium sp. SH661 TaxID=3448124 RepID=UPI003F5B82B8